jgi:hypothetical protein
MFIIIIRQPCRLYNKRRSSIQGRCKWQTKLESQSCARAALDAVSASRDTLMEPEEHGLSHAHQCGSVETGAINK